MSDSGPSSPMDAKATITATSGAAVTVTPASADQAVPALAIGAPRKLAATVALTCARPGEHTVGIAASVEPAGPDDLDPDRDNNQRAAEFTVDCVVPVAVNIHPGGDPNSVNPPNATVPLAVLTTAASEYGLPLAFDATTIRPLTVRFGPEAAVWGGGAGASETHRASSAATRSG